jgi:nucleolar GTP-binding protein
MGFQQIPKIENAKFYVNLAFKHANEKAKKARENVSRQRSVLEKSKIIEIEKLRAAKDFLIDTLEHMTKKFPSLNNLNRFFLELMKCYIDIDELRKSLGALKWAGSKISDFFILYKNKIKATRDFKKVNQYRSMFYGRASSAMKQIDKNLKVIEDARRIMKDFPVLKEGIFTVAIAGFPNVGKSTLLAKLTGAKPEIAPYVFTTKGLNTGYITEKNERVVQLIDTPGTLNRFEKMNMMEKQSYIAMKYAADLIVFVFDPTETYSREEQEKLLERIREETDAKIIIYVSKTDINESDIKGIKNFEELKKELLKLGEKFKTDQDLPEQAP